MTSETRPLAFPLRTTRLATLRDVAVVAVCIALVASFVFDLWRAPAHDAPSAVASAPAAVVAA